MTKKLLSKEQIISSATNAIRYILAMKEDVEEIHKKKLLSEMIWKITEAGGKHNTGYISEGGKKELEVENLIHEHVYQRKNLIRNLIDNPKEIDQILKKAIACLVTKEEDKRLHEIDKFNRKNKIDIDGWKRYEQAKIEYFSTRLGK